MEFLQQLTVDDLIRVGACAPVVRQRAAKRKITAIPVSDALELARNDVERAWILRASGHPTSSYGSGSGYGYGSGSGDSDSDGSYKLEKTIQLLTQ